MPMNSYTRKNIGYLYAIKHGAEWIYDTDDDNKPYGDGLDGFDYEPFTSGLRYTSTQARNSSLAAKLFNPYSFFGQQEMWPRGFPLEAVQSHIKNNPMMLCSHMRTAAVQQGLVHNDPDVDAIYRLLNADRNKGLSEGFNPYAPPIQIDNKVYAPWNSQNTVFHRRAFFTMFLPTTVAFRVTDIWRSYFSQRLLHLVGENIAFYPVNAVQHRNPHDYLNDFSDERALYEQSGKMVKFLDEWNCENKTIEECTVELADAFAERKFWEKDDAKLVRMWIDDLKAIGYEFPPIPRSPYLSYAEDLNSTNTHFRGLNCRRAKLSFSEPRPATDVESLVSRTEQKIQNFREISDWCKMANYTTLIDGIEDRDKIFEAHRENTAIHQKLNMALIIVNNYPWKMATGLFQCMYEPYFATIIFCGTMLPHDESEDKFPRPRSNLNYIHMTEKEVYRGTFIYMCMARARQLRLRNITGYVMMSDDSAFNHWHPILETKTTHPHGHVGGTNWWKIGQGERFSGEKSAEAIVKNLKTIHKDNVEVQNTWREFEERLIENGVINETETALDYIGEQDGRAVSDWFYIPSSDMDFFQKLMDLFFEARFFLEIAVGKYLRASEFAVYPDTAISLINNRDQWPKKYNKNIIMLHPIKLSFTNTDYEKRKFYCAKVLQVHANVTLKLEPYEPALPEQGCPTKFTKMENTTICDNSTLT